MSEQDLAVIEQQKGLEGMVMGGIESEVSYAKNKLEGISSGEPQVQPITPIPETQPQQNVQPVNNEIQPQVDVPVNQPVSNDIQPQANQQPEQNVFTSNFMGQDVSMADDDGFMNRTDMNGLKNAFVHNNQYIDTLKKQRDEQDRLSREEIARVSSEKEELLKQLELYKSQQPQINTVNPQVQQPNGFNTQQQPQPQPQGYQQPEQQNSFNPTPLDGDVYDWGDAHINTLNNTVQVAQKIPTLEQKVIEMQKAQNEFQQKYAEMQQVEQSKLDAQKAELEQKQYLDEVHEFIGQNDRFKVLGNDIMKYDQDADRWMEEVSMANGNTRPYTNNQQDIEAYNQKKYQIAQSYMNNDPYVMRSSSHIQKPNGIERYFELSNILKEKDKYNKLKDNNGAPMVNLQDVWVLQQSRNGGFQNGMNQTIQDSYKQGAQAMAGIQENVANHAVNLPNSASQTGDSSGVPQNMSFEEASQIIYMDPVRGQQAYPDFEKKFAMASQLIKSMQQ